MLCQAMQKHKMNIQSAGIYSEGYTLKPQVLRGCYIPLPTFYHMLPI